MTPRFASIRSSGFSLIELLFVLSIISVLTALLFPTFLTARGKAREIVCVSNLRQIGIAIEAYKQDYDSYFPYAADPADRQPGRWTNVPEFAAELPRISMLHDVLQPYTGSSQVFSCPADIGFSATDFPYVPLDAFPSSYQKFGTSYYYATTFAACHWNDAIIRNPSKQGVLFDGTGFWHGTLIPLMPRYNVLFADNHVKNLSLLQTEEAWGRQLAKDCSN